MERVPEILQLPVVVQGGRPLALERQPLEKGDFPRVRAAAEGRVLKEFLEPGLFARRLFGVPLDKRESLRLPWDEAVVQDNLQTERRQVDVPDSISGSRNATQFSADRWKMSVSRNSSTTTRISS